MINVREARYMPPDGQGARITFSNGGHNDVKQVIADVRAAAVEHKRVGAQDIAAWVNHSASSEIVQLFLSAAQCRRSVNRVALTARRSPPVFRD